MHQSMPKRQIIRVQTKSKKGREWKIGRKNISIEESETTQGSR